jgi:hypothetical protein
LRKPRLALLHIRDPVLFLVATGASIWRKPDRSFRAPIATGLALGQLPSGSALAADLVAELRMDQVTVYPEGAAITRLGTLEIPAGEHRVIVRGLPSSLDENALHVAVMSIEIVAA